MSTPNQICRERLYLTADKSKLVREGDTSAAFLFAAPGTEIPASAVERFGLVDGRLLDATLPTEAEMQAVFEAEKAAAAALAEAEALAAAEEAAAAKAEPETKPQDAPETKPAAAPETKPAALPETKPAAPAETKAAAPARKASARKGTVKATAK